jgi:glycosyltransferase involved in cell wall biosynthesis
MNHFSGHLALQQRALPTYRAPFFDLLARSCDRLSFFAGLPLPEENIVSAKSLQVADFTSAENIHLFRGAFYLCYQRGFVNWLEEKKPDALIVEANPRYLSTPSAVKWMRSRGRKVIGWGLGSPLPSGPLSGFRQMWRRQFLSQFDALIAYSQRGAEEYAAHGFPREKIFVAHNSVAPKPTEHPKPKPQSVERLAILFVGRLQARKRIDSLLRACAELNQNIRLIIIGDGPERQNLEALAKQIYPSAEFGGAKHGDELKPYFAQADLFVLPGTGGLAVQEAMSNGLPVIVAKGDGTQDDLVRDENGWQIPPDDYGALVATMREALSDVSRLRKMGEESFRIVSDEINLEKMVEAFVTALNSFE